MFTLCMIDNCQCPCHQCPVKMISLRTAQHPEEPIKISTSPRSKKIFYKKSHELNNFYSAKVNFFLLSHFYYSNQETFKSAKLPEYNYFLIQPLEFLLSCQGTTVHIVHFPSSYTKTHALPMHKQYLQVAHSQKMLSHNCHHL